MGFLDQLLKGFVRSAVNQVGRDTGRVISASIYEKSTPKFKTRRYVTRRQLQPVYVQGPPPTSTDVYDKKGNLVRFGADGLIPNEWIYENATPIIYESTIRQNIVKLFWLFFLPFYAEIYLIVIGIRCALKNKVYYQATQSFPIYIQDRYQKLGYRQVGYEDRQVVYEMPADRHFVDFIIKGAISLLLAVFLGTYHYKFLNALYLYIKESF